MIITIHMRPWVNCSHFSGSFVEELTMITNPAIVGSSRTSHRKGDGFDDQRKTGMECDRGRISSLLPLAGNRLCHGCHRLLPSGLACTKALTPGSGKRILRRRKKGSCQLGGFPHPGNRGHLGKGLCGASQ